MELAGRTALVTHCPHRYPKPIRHRGFLPYPQFEEQDHDQVQYPAASPTRHHPSGVRRLPRTNHAPLFMSLPVVQQHVRRYAQQHTIDATMPGLPPTTIDGITELWFDDVDSIAAVFTADSYLETIRPDEAKFLDLEHCEFIVSDEHPVFP